nr:hypothetical protein [Halapricum sp. CBA1109]
MSVVAAAGAWRASVPSIAVVVSTTDSVALTINEAIASDCAGGSATSVAGAATRW